MNPMQYSVEQIRSIILDACNSLYGESKDNQYFIVKDSTVGKVEFEILNQLEEDLRKNKYLDMAVYILQTGSDVFIRIV